MGAEDDGGPRAATEKLIYSADGKSPLGKLPDPIGWKNWQVGDWLWAVNEDNKPLHPKAGEFTDEECYRQHKDLNIPYNPVRNPELTIGHHLSRRFFTPTIKTFATDMGANILNFQQGRCQDFELNALECIEYYGSKQGLTACKDWYDDYIECVHQSKQKLRIKAMFKKRAIDNHLEYLQGKRTWNETYEPPPKAHAYVEPWFDPKFAGLATRDV